MEIGGGWFFTLEAKSAWVPWSLFHGFIAFSVARKWS